MKKGISELTLILGLLVIVIGFIGYNMFATPQQVAGPSGGDDGVPGEFCDLAVVSPDIDINAYDVDNPDTAVTDANNLWRKISGGDGTWTSWTLGTEITGLEYDETYEFYIPGDLAASNVKDKAFGKYMTFTAPCKEDTVKRIEVANDETHDGLSATFYNEDHNAAAQTFSAGDVKTVELVWKAGKDEYYGHPYLKTYPMLSDHGAWSRDKPNVLCLKLNSTTWDKPQAVYLANGEELDAVSGGQITQADGAATHIMYCYEMALSDQLEPRETPVITDQRLSIFVDLDADDSEAPDVDDMVLEAILIPRQTAYLYSGNLYWDTDTAEPKIRCRNGTNWLNWGIEDRNNTFVEVYFLQNDGNYCGGNGNADELTLDKAIRF